MSTLTRDEQKALELFTKAVAAIQALGDWAEDESLAIEANALNVRNFVVNRAIARENSAALVKSEPSAIEGVDTSIPSEPSSVDS